MSRTCILLPLYPGYRDLAAITEHLIRQNWPDHPPIRRVGVSLVSEPNTHAIEVPDWYTLLGAAITHLQSLGFERAYFLLEDMGPIARCHAEHLNHTIPRWMDELDAGLISIRGWDFRRHSSGTSLGARYHHLQQQSTDYPWRYSLHPGLWRLETLKELLALLLASPQHPGRTAWDFERDAGKVGHRLPRGADARTFRIAGRDMMAELGGVVARRLRQARDGVARELEWKTHGVLAGHPWLPRARKLTARFLRTDDVFYEGPYPHFFGGFVIRGRPNVHLMRHLARHRGDERLIEYLAALDRRSSKVSELGEVTPQSGPRGDRERRRRRPGKQSAA